MADEAVGHMTERVVIPEKAAIPIVNRKGPSVPPSDYRTFKAGADLIPEFAVAGQGYFVRMESLTHDELGRPSLTAETQQVLVGRLQEKITRNAHEIAECEEYLLEDADVLVVAYGITSRCVRQAVDEARAEGIKAGLLRLITVWPFPSWRIEELAAQAKAFLVPEVNFGQIVHEVERAVAGRVPTKFVQYTPGAMPHPNRTLKAIREVAT
jgi:2-oxoglutarate ferredoxin oxidoreductase subunit alpha